MPEGLFPPSLSHRFPQRRIAMLLCPCKLFITVCEVHQQSNQYSSWQSHRSSELLDKVISVMSSRPRKLLSATKFCIFFFILTCVNFNFELRRLRHHHNIIMAYLMPHLTESKSDLSLNDGSNFFSTCVTWKTTCTIIYTPNSLPIYIDSMLTLPT